MLLITHHLRRHSIPGCCAVFAVSHPPDAKSLSAWRHQRTDALVDEIRRDMDSRASSWRDLDSYRYPRTEPKQDRPRWAWEFLRRNQTYWDAYAWATVSHSHFPSRTWHVLRADPLSDDAPHFSIQARIPAFPVIVGTWTDPEDQEDQEPLELYDPRDVDINTERRCDLELWPGHVAAVINLAEGTVKLSQSLPAWTSRQDSKRLNTGVSCPTEHAFPADFELT